MVTRKILVGLSVTTIMLTGCQPSRPNLPYGPAAYQQFPAPVAGQAGRAYQIGPFDTIAISVFQEPDLSVRDVQVDAGGNVILPLLGELHAGGQTSTQLAQTIARLLDQRFLENPQVSVLVQQSVSQKVTVEGSVIEPGVYEISGRTTLIDALSMAKGPSRVAKLNQVAVFREINGQQMGALFDVTKIRRGEAPDPEILGNDTVVVNLSNVKAAWRDVLTASPLVAAFRPFN